MIPATPNAEETVRRPAPPVWVEELLEEVLVAVPEAGDPVELEPEPVEGAPEPPVPVSVTFALTHESVVPAAIVTMLEYAAAPVLSFKEIVLQTVVSMSPTANSNGVLTSWCPVQGQHSMCTRYLFE